MPFTAVAERSTISLFKLKNFLKMDQDFTDSDTVLELALAAAKEDADKFLINPFTTNNRPDGTATAIPSTVEYWVLKRTAQLVEWTILGQTKESLEGIGNASVAMETDYTDIFYLRNPAGLVGF